MATEVLWWIFAGLTVVLSAGVVFSRSVLHSAIFLIGSLTGVGVMYVFLTADFLALVQFLVYGGAVTVLILLALMLTRANPSGIRESVNGPQAPYAALAGIALLAVLVVASVDVNWPGNGPDIRPSIPFAQLSEKLFVDFGPPFVIASVLLLVALVGAIILARQEEGE